MSGNFKLFILKGKNMARTGINYADVAEAATKIIKEGKNPTIQNVRNLLGTGSNSTISHHLRTFRLDNKTLSSKQHHYDQGYRDALKDIQHQITLLRRNKGIY